MRRIPAKWLNQAVSFYAKGSGGYDDYGNPVDYGDEVGITRIRIEYNVATTNSTNGETMVDDAVLYYDPVQSSPAGLSFPRKSKIVFGGDTFLVRLYDPKFDETGRLHHVELRLTGNES